MIGLEVFIVVHVIRGRNHKVEGKDKENYDKSTTKKKIAVIQTGKGEIHPTLLKAISVLESHDHPSHEEHEEKE